MGWQTQVAIQLQAGDTIINATADATYSGAPAAGNLSSSKAPFAFTDQFGNHGLAGVATYGSLFATSLNAGFINFYTGSLAGGWSVAGSIQTDSSGDILLVPAAGRQVTTTNNTLDDGSGNMTIAANLTVSTINGSSNTGSGNNGGVTSGPSGTVNAFPAAGPNHTHAEVHQHPI